MSLSMPKAQATAPKPSSQIATAAHTKKRPLDTPNTTALSGAKKVKLDTAASAVAKVVETEQQAITKLKQQHASQQKVRETTQKQSLAAMSSRHQKELSTLTSQHTRQLQQFTRSALQSEQAAMSKQQQQLQAQGLLQRDPVQAQAILRRQAQLGQSHTAQLKAKMVTTHRQERDALTKKHGKLSADLKQAQLAENRKREQMQKQELDAAAKEHIAVAQKEAQGATPGLAAAKGGQTNASAVAKKTVPESSTSFFYGSKQVNVAADAKMESVGADATVSKEYAAKSQQRIVELKQQQASQQKGREALQKLQIKSMKARHQHELSTLTIQHTRQLQQFTQVAVHGEQAAMSKQQQQLQAQGLLQRDPVQAQAILLRQAQLSQSHTAQQKLEMQQMHAQERLRVTTGQKQQEDAMMHGHREVVEASQNHAEAERGIAQVKQQGLGMWSVRGMDQVIRSHESWKSMVQVE